MRVLIVDDSDIAIDILRGTLTQAGYDVDCATNGREAMEKLRQGACRLVISDWDMPEMDGLELCQAIRAGDLPGYIYVILLTAHDRSEEKVAGLAAGADDFIPKPFNPAELVARVRTGE